MWGWTMGKDETLATIWEIPDHLWEQIHPVILDMDPPKSTGRKRADPRRMLDGIIFRMRSGCQWNRLPRELGDDSTIHRTFQWVELGVLEGIGLFWWRAAKNWAEWTGNGSRRTAPWARLVLGGRHWTQPHRPGQSWEQEEHPGHAAGGPLSVAVAGANVHDTKLLRRPGEHRSGAPGRQNLCLDSMTIYRPRDRCAWVQYCPHIRRIGEEKLDRWGEQTFPARRWVVERTLSWLSKCRAILVRYDKKASNYVGLIQLACALLWYRRQHRLLF